jgi:hypothetical protein
LDEINLFSGRESIGIYINEIRPDLGVANSDLEFPIKNQFLELKCGRISLKLVPLALALALALAFIVKIGVRIKIMSLYEN